MDIESRLLPVNSVRADYGRAHHYVEVAAGVTPAHIVEPEFWQHLAGKFRVNDRIEVVSREFDAELRVVGLDARNLWAKVRLLRICGPEGLLAKQAGQLPAADRPSVDDLGYVIESDGLGKFRIVQGRDLIAKGFADRAAAEAALANLKKPAPKAA